MDNADKELRLKTSDMFRSVRCPEHCYSQLHIKLIILLLFFTRLICRFIVGGKTDSSHGGSSKTVS